MARNRLVNGYQHYRSFSCWDNLVAANCGHHDWYCLSGDGRALVSVSSGWCTVLLVFHGRTRGLQALCCFCVSRPSFLFRRGLNKTEADRVWLQQRMDQHSGLVVGFRIGRELHFFHDLINCVALVSRLSCAALSNMADLLRAVMVGCGSQRVWVIHCPNFQHTPV
jgi:hypothetical protein